MFSTKDSELHIAIKNRDLKLAESLIKKGANVNLPGSNGETPLHCAARINSAEIITLLLKNKADPEKISNDGDKPIHVAAYNNADRALKTLVNFDKSQLTTKGRENRTAFYVAAMLNNKESMNVLIKAGADINQLDDNTGQTAMHYAMEKNNIELLNYLLKMKANKEVLNKEKLTPLQLGTSILENASHQANVKLIEAGANLNPTTGIPPLYLLAKYSNEDSPHATELAKLLHTRGAKIQDKFGDNPLEVLNVINIPQLNR